MLKRQILAITALVRSVSARFKRLNTPGNPPLSPALLTASPKIPIPSSENYLEVPVRDQSENVDSSLAVQNRGLFLARQDRWEDLSREIQQADSTRKTTPDGMPIAELLALGARSDAVQAFEHAVADGQPFDGVPILDGITGLEAVRREHSKDPYIALVVAQAHIDMGWIRRGNGVATALQQQNHNKCSAHFDRAAALLGHFDALQLKSPAMASAQCALLAGRENATSRVVQDYECLIDLDPKNHRHLRAFGVNLLPRWFGNYDQLELEARRTAARTEKTWGAGGYTWVYLDAIAIDDEACQGVDVDFFIDGLKDIIAARPDQEMVNFLASYCAVVLRHRQGIEPDSDLARLRIVECENWLIRDHLTEVHPIVWAHASDGFDNSTRVSSLRRFAARGRVDAMQVIADQFRDDINRGNRVTFTSAGARLNPA